MSELGKDISAFEANQKALESDHLGEWVLFHNAKQFGLFGTFEEAAKAAVAHFGRGPYLIRQIGAAQKVMPASVMFRPVNV